jgi:hypothetical protein
MLGDEKEEKLLDDDNVQKLVLVHLLHNCYKETADAFISTCSLLSEGRRGVNQVKMGDLSEFNPNGEETEEMSCPVSDVSAVQQASEKLFAVDATSEATPMCIDTEGTSDAIEAEKKKELSSFLSPAYFETLQCRKGEPTSVCRYYQVIHIKLSLLLLGLRQYVLQGKIQLAIELCQKQYPCIISTDKTLTDTTSESIDLSFKLHCQHFIECIREGNSAEALNYAQQVLGQFGYLDTKYLQELQDVVALIAYTDPTSSPVSGYLSQKHREMIADSINSAILSRFETLFLLTLLLSKLRQVM